MEKKKKNKIIAIVLVITILILWIIFIIFDCIRINNSEMELKPLITIMHTKEVTKRGELRDNYIGLGYSVTHYRYGIGYGTRVRMFYVFLLPRFNAE